MQTLSNDPPFVPFVFFSKRTTLLFFFLEAETPTPPLYFPCTQRMKRIALPPFPLDLPYESVKAVSPLRPAQPFFFRSETERAAEFRADIQTILYVFFFFPRPSWFGMCRCLERSPTCLEIRLYARICFEGFLFREDDPQSLSSGTARSLFSPTHFPGYARSKNAVCKSLELPFGLVHFFLGPSSTPLLPSPPPQSFESDPSSSQSFESPPNALTDALSPSYFAARFSLLAPGPILRVSVSSGALPFALPYETFAHLKEDSFFFSFLSLLGHCFSFFLTAPPLASLKEIGFTPRSFHSRPPVAALVRCTLRALSFFYVWRTSHFYSS